MQIIKLDKAEVTKIYNEHMLYDFPDDERKPLAMIIKGMDNQAYECLGVQKDDDIVAYAFFVKNGHDYLFDYLAVTDGNRNNKIGSWFLENIEKYYSSANSVIGEVEDPDYAESLEDKEIQTRRFGFYLRNGYVDTGVRVKMFGVHYCIIELKKDEPHSEEIVKELYQMHYKSFLPEHMYAKNVIIK